MGQLLTKIYGHAKREVQIYNIERRAEKVISREKPVPAPKYPSTVLEIERLKEENVSKEELQKKDYKLDEYLKKVYVTAENPKLVKSETNPDRPLPQSRITDDESLFGYSNSEERSVPAGRLSLKQALQFIVDHHSDPNVHSNTTIAARYKLPVTLTDDILEHFKMFDVHLKNKDGDKANLTTYEKLSKRVQEMNLGNASQIMREFPQFRKKIIFGKNKLEKIEDTEQSNIDMDKSSTDLPKDDKKKR